MKPDEFYPLIGRIALSHAGIEQDIKRVLVEDWDYEEEKVERFYGGKLQELFLREIKTLLVPEKYCNAYSVVMDRFKHASENRNQLIKAAYGLTEEDGEVFKYDFKARGKYDYKMNFNEWKRKGTKIITFEEVASLVKVLDQIHDAFFKISKAVYTDKKQLIDFFEKFAVPIPTPVPQNPYKYIHDNKIEGFYNVEQI